MLREYNDKKGGYVIINNDFTTEWYDWHITGFIDCIFHGIHVHTMIQSQSINNITSAIIEEIVKHFIMKSINLKEIVSTLLVTRTSISNPYFWLKSYISCVIIKQICCLLFAHIM